MVDYYPRSTESTSYYNWGLSNPTAAIQSHVIKQEHVAYSDYSAANSSYTAAETPLINGAAAAQRLIKRPPSLLSDNVSETESNGGGEPAAILPDNRNDSNSNAAVNGGSSAIPPLTPGTNKNFSDVLRTTYGTWDKDCERLGK